jgi:hypothetical protein
MFYKERILELEKELAALDHKAFVLRKKLNDKEYDSVWELKDLIEQLKKQNTEIETVAKNAISRKWCFEHVVHYLQKIIGLPLQDVNKLVAVWDL